MIESFADGETEKVFRGIASRRLPLDVQKTARRKLLYLNEADSLRDLAAPPGNRLEELRGDRAGQHSIRSEGEPLAPQGAPSAPLRINDQWRMCFTWAGGNARDVEIVDYHS